jgi:hypothetical protein
MRRPNHARPLAGAAFAVSFTAMLGVGATVVALRSGQPTYVPLLIPVFGALFAVGLQHADLGVLRVVGTTRPERFRSLWRWMWRIAPPVGAVAGVVSALLHGSR